METYEAFRRSTVSPVPPQQQQFPNDNLFQFLDPPLWLLTVRDTVSSSNDAEREQHLNRGLLNGMIIAHVAPASLPTAGRARVVVECSNDHLTTDIIRRTQRFVLNLLDARQYRLVSHFGLQSGHKVEKFHNCYWSGTDVGDTEPLFELQNTNPDSAASTTDIPVLAGVCGWMECRVTDTVQFADSSLFVAQVMQQHASIAEKDVSISSETAQSAHNDVPPQGGYRTLTRRVAYRLDPTMFQRHQSQRQTHTDAHDRLVVGRPTL